MPPYQNPHQTVTRFVCVGFSMPKCDNFACLHTRQDQNELLLRRRYFLAKIGIFCKSIADRSANALNGQLSSAPEPIELCMASYPDLYPKFVSMMSPKCLIVEDDGELMFMAFHTHFLPQQQYSRVYALFLAFHTLVYR